MKHQQPRLRIWVGAAGLGLFLQAVTGCIYDTDQPCDEGMEVYGDNVRCICPVGSLYTPEGCITCGADHEVPTPSGCICEDGYTRPAPGAACAETPSGLGMACDPQGSTCTAPFDHCEPATDGGYCTSSCATSEDCEGGYACNAASICQRPPLGLGQACTSDADCAGTEATFCDAFMGNSCQVQGCQLDPNNCFVGYECCDLSGFGLPQPLCLPGACP